MATVQGLTNEELQASAEWLLRETDYEDLHNVRVVVDGARLTLMGQVRSYYRKQLAQEFVRHLALEHGRRVLNNLSVDEARLL